MGSSAPRARIAPVGPIVATKAEIGLAEPSDGAARTRLGTMRTFRIDDGLRHDGAVLSAYGELDLHVTPELQDRIDSAVDEGAKLVVLDLSGVTFIDSMALGVLLGAVNRLKQDGGNLRLVVPNPELRRIFEISLLDRVFTLDSTREEACARLTPAG
jgi:anti-sigma B factor antagonist